MSLESSLFDVLKALCPRIFPDVAKAGTVRPYVTWQALGGSSLRALDGAALDKRHTLMQINAWATTRDEANALIRSIEDAMCASQQFIARPEGEPLSTYEEDVATYGALQRFSIYSAR